MTPHRSYVALLLFASASTAPGYRPLYREDVVLLHAPSDEEARAAAERHGRAAETSCITVEGETVEVRFLQLVDVAPALEDDLTGTADLYSRHFRDLDAYRTMDPLLAGEPL